jgi:hypothetical protein
MSAQHPEAPGSSLISWLVLVLLGASVIAGLVILALGGG